MKRFLSWLLISAGILSLQAGEEKSWTIPAAETFQEIVPPPPLAGSPADRADLDGVEGLQASATKEMVEHAEKSVAFTVFNFAEVRGREFKADSFPKTAAFFKKLESTVNPPKNWLKDHYHRERPFVAHPDLVKKLVTSETGFSYPSGHSLRAWLDALVLGELDPAHRADYLGCAWQVNIDRIIGGMHYPSDTSASRSLAEALFGDLMADSEFRNELEELKKSEFQIKP
jgi:acid phosphatase (class A)